MDSSSSLPAPHTIHNIAKVPISERTVQFAATFKLTSPVLSTPVHLVVEKPKSNNHIELTLRCSVAGASSSLPQRSLRRAFSSCSASICTSRCLPSATSLDKCALSDAETRASLSLATAGFDAGLPHSNVGGESSTAVGVLSSSSTTRGRSSREESGGTGGGVSGLRCGESPPTTSVELMSRTSAAESRSASKSSCRVASCSAST